MSSPVALFQVLLKYTSTLSATTCTYTNKKRSVCVFCSDYSFRSTICSVRLLDESTVSHMENVLFKSVHLDKTPDISPSLSHALTHLPSNKWSGYVTSTDPNRMTFNHSCDILSWNDSFRYFFVNDKFSLLLIEGTCEKPWTALLANVKAPCVGLSRKCSVCCQESPRILKLFIAKWTPNAASHTTNACANPSGVVINQVQLINADVSVVPNGMDSTSSPSHDLAIG